MDEEYANNIKNMSENEVRLKARSRTRHIQEDLEKKAKRIKPEKFVPCVLNFFHDPSRKIVIAPHTILQAIEANCAYHKSGYDEDVTWEKFADIVNLIKTIEDENDFYLWSIHHSIELFFQFISRIQFEVQKTGFYKRYLSRYWKLFYDNCFTPRLFKDFEKEFGISIEKWFLCSICMYTLFYKSFSASKNIKIPPGINVTTNDIQRYLNLSICSVEDIKRKYFEDRKDVPREFHFLTRTAFIERPILELGNGQIVAPIPQLIFRHMGHKLSDLFENIDSNGYYLGKSFQEYTKKTLSCLSNIVRLYSNEELEKLSAGERSCDFLLATKSENILVECKAVDFKIRTLTQNAILKSNAFKKIKDAMHQIDHTLNNIKAGKLSLQGVDMNKPFLKVIVTFGEIPGGNSDWLLYEMWPSIKNIDEKTSKPIILSIDSLEELIIYIESTGESFIDIYRSKQEKGYFMTGDWDAYLNNKISGIKQFKKLGFFIEGFDKMYAKLGVGLKPAGE